MILAYLEGMESAEIGELTEISARNVSTKAHRVKNLPAPNFHDQDTMSNELNPKDPASGQARKERT